MALTFTKTDEVLREYGASPVRMRGVHKSDIIRTGTSGQKVIEIPFDPNKHTPDKINPLSIMGMVIEEPYVTKVRPRYPLIANLVIDRSKEQSAPGIIAAKNLVASGIRKAIAEAMPGVSDKLHQYVIGEPMSEDLGDYDLETLELNGDKQKFAVSLAELCMSGLSFVISDFESLPIDQLPQRRFGKGNFSSAVGIKINHPAELDISSTQGYRATLPLFGKREVNLKHADEVEDFNKVLSEHHDRVIDRMNAAGFAVAQVVYNPEFSMGFDPNLADRQISSAIERISGRQ